MSAENGGQTAIWLDEDIQAFLGYLAEHKAQAGDNGNFKIVTFRNAAIFMQDYSTQGVPKTAESCKNKYQSVCSFHSF